MKKVILFLVIFFCQPAYGFDSPYGSVIGMYNSAAGGGPASQTRVPTGQGVSNGWTPTGAATVWEALDDTPGACNDLVYAARADSASSTFFTFPAFSITSTSIDSVVVNFRCAETIADSSVRARLYINSTSYAGGDQSLTTDFTDLIQTWDTNPATSLAWTEDDVEGVGANPIAQWSLEARGMAAGEETRCSCTSITVNYQQ